ncbi:MAG: hypothetical protein Q8K63_00740 [Acidimicrobiales bacterium]|nr:hypothetical protein [Acidimicrobiales bacterium]
MTIQDQITTQARTTVKQIQDFLANLPQPVTVVEKAFDYSEVFLANARTVAVDAAKTLSPQTAKATKKPTAKKATASATAE